MAAGPADANVVPAASLAPIVMEVRESGVNPGHGAGRFDIRLKRGGAGNFGQSSAIGWIED